jgi:hypothetical protein
MAQQAINRTNKFTALRNILIGSLSRDAKRRISLSHSAVDTGKEPSTPFPRGPSYYKIAAKRGRAEAAMKFAKIVFWIAGIWGLLVITPLYFFFDLIGQKDPPAITHPGFFYGFVGCALAWQVAFCLMATDPPRYRPLMIPSVLEKASYAVAVVTLVVEGRMHPSDLVFAGTDSLLGLLFVIAYFKTRPGLLA